MLTYREGKQLRSRQTIRSTLPTLTPHAVLTRFPCPFLPPVRLVTLFTPHQAPSLGRSYSGRKMGNGGNQNGDFETLCKIGYWDWEPTSWGDRWA